METFFTNAIDAVKEGNSREAGHCIGWLAGSGWFVYQPTTPPAFEFHPEFLCLGDGHTPLALSENAIAVWLSIIREAA